MGHYDNCRPGYCGKCGAGPGNIRADGTCNICITDAAHTRTLGTTAMQRERRANETPGPATARPPAPPMPRAGVCRSPYCECQPGICALGMVDARGELPKWEQLQDHKVAQLVNRVRDLCRTMHDSQQLRDRLAGVITPEVFPVNPRTLPMLRDLRLWHWRQLLRNRQLAEEMRNDPNGVFLGMDSNIADEAANQHMRFVQLLNIFFPTGDYAEGDLDRERQRTPATRA